MHRWAATALLLALALAEAPSSATTGEEAGSWLPAHAAHAANAAPAAPVAVPVAAAATGLSIQNTTTVFKDGDCDALTGRCWFCFRIPAVKVLHNGHILAFAEARNNSGCNDYYNVSIVVRRSVDGGASWQGIVAVAVFIGDGAGKFGPNSEGANTQHRVGNPSPVVDWKTGRVYVMFAIENQYAFLTHSDNEGQSWTERRTLDKRCPWPPQEGQCGRSPLCCMFGPGVGGGTQLDSGRLIVLAERSRVQSRVNRSQLAYSSIPVYSEDAGATWLAGEPLPVTNNRTHGIGEPSVAIVGKSLIMSGRSLGDTSAPHGVLSTALSHDGGLHWEQAVPIDTIRNGGCQSSVIGAPDGSVALISSPVYPYGKARYNVSIFVAAAPSFKQWRLAGLVQAGPGAYSSLAVADAAAKSYFVLFEAGAAGSSGQYAFDQTIRMARFTLKSDDHIVLDLARANATGRIFDGIGGSASSKPVDTAAAATSTATRTCSFPATKGLPFCNNTAPTSVRVADLVARLTSAEKLSMMLSLQEAAPRLKVNAYDWGNECLHGVALESGVGGLAGATIFPQPIGLGASFNPALLHAIGDAISTEARALSNAGVEKTPGVPAFQDCWAPNMNIYRDPR